MPQVFHAQDPRLFKLQDESPIVVLSSAVSGVRLGKTDTGWSLALVAGESLFFV